MIWYIRVKINGGLKLVQELLDGLPGDHKAEDKGDDVYLVATTSPIFLAFAIENQGYGLLLKEER